MHDDVIIHDDVSTARYCKIFEDVIFYLLYVLWTNLSFGSEKYKKGVQGFPTATSGGCGGGAASGAGHFSGGHATNSSNCILTASNVIINMYDNKDNYQCLL